MSNFIPKPADNKTRGIGLKAQTFQALLEKAATQVTGGDKTLATSSTASVRAEDSFAGTKKTSLQRKAA